VSPRNRALTAAVAAVLVVTSTTAAVVATADAVAPAPAAAASEVPAGFQDVEVIGNISEATSVAFAPSGTAFVAEKPGTIKAFDYDAGTGTWETTGGEFANLRSHVNNYWDRGLTGIEVDPQFPTSTSTTSTTATRATTRRSCPGGGPRRPTTTSAPPRRRRHRPGSAA
jgi:glucose/arabinose dehydrogenase